jgi:hypothetical protein
MKDSAARRVCPAIKVFRRERGDAALGPKGPKEEKTEGEVSRTTGVNAWAREKYRLQLERNISNPK